MYSYRCLCILIVVYVFLDAATLTKVFPCFFLGCKANARVILAKTGHGRHSSKIVVLFYVLFVFILFYVLFVCKCVLPPGDNPIAVNKYIISFGTGKFHEGFDDRFQAQSGWNILTVLDYGISDSIKSKKK